MSTTAESAWTHSRDESLVPVSTTFSSTWSPSCIAESSSTILRRFRTACGSPCYPPDDCSHYLRPFMTVTTTIVKIAFYRILSNNLLLAGPLSNYSLSVNGLHSQTIDRIQNDRKLPNTSPPTRQKLATVAATSTSCLLPCSRGLCSSEGADIMQRLDT